MKELIDLWKKLGLVSWLILLGWGSIDIINQDEKQITIGTLMDREMIDLIESLSCVDYFSFMKQLPKWIKISWDVVRSRYYEWIFTIPKRLWDTFTSIDDSESIDKVIEKMKSMESVAKDKGDVELQKKYHDMIVKLYVKKMEGIGLAPSDPVQRKHFFKKMSPHEIEAYAIIHMEKIFELYSKDPETKNVANTDDFRKYLWEDVWITSEDTHAAASILSQQYFDYLLETGVWEWNKTIKFLAWWAWSGKSSISAFPETSNSQFPWVYDGTLKSYDFAESLIKKTIARWYDIRIEFVYRDITDAFIHWVLERTIKQNQYYRAQWTWKFSWRAVSLHAFEIWHKWARETIIKLYEKYWDSVVKFFWWLFDDLPVWDWILRKVAWVQWKWPRFVYEYDIEYIKKRFAQDKLDIEKCKLAIEEAYLRWQISLSQKKELLWKYI